MNAVSYVRYSSHNQRDASLEDQERANEAAAAAEGDTIVAVYFDRATSGTTDKRDGFQAMIRDAEGYEWRSVPTTVREWGRVWTYKTDRFARDRYDAAVYKRRLKKRRIDVKYAAEQIPDGPTGILMESVLEGMAEYYSANLGENIKRGLMGNALKCHPNGVKRYGWDIAGAHIDDNGKYHPGDRYEVNEREAAAIRELSALRRSGLAWEAVAASLWDAGHRGKHGARMSATACAKIASDPALWGVYHFGGVCVEGGIPAIISEREWVDLQNARARGRVPRARRPRPKRYRKPVRVRPGMVFGDLEAVEVARVDGHHHYLWLCKCHACNNTKAEWATRLTSGRATHCGCLSGDGRERDELGRYA